MIRLGTVQHKGILLGLFIIVLSQPMSAGVITRSIRACSRPLAEYYNQRRQGRLPYDLAEGRLFAQAVHPFRKEMGHPFTLPWTSADIPALLQSQNALLRKREIFARLYDDNGATVASLVCGVRPFFIRINEDEKKAAYRLFMRAYLFQPMTFVNPRRYKDLHNAGICEAVLLQETIDSLKKHEVHVVMTHLPRGASKQHALYTSEGFKISACGYAYNLLAEARDDNGLPIKVDTSCKKSCLQEKSCAPVSER